MNKRGKIPKKLSLYCCISGRIKQGNLVLLTGFRSCRLAKLTF